MGAKHMRFVRWLRPLFSRKAARRNQTARQRRLRAADAAAAAADDAAAAAALHEQTQVVCRGLMLRASVGRAARCRARKRRGGRSSRLNQNKVARREADAARRRRSRAADATATRSNVCGVVYVCRCRACRRRGGRTSRAEERGGS